MNKISVCLFPLYIAKGIQTVYLHYREQSGLRQGENRHQYMLFETPIPSIFLNHHIIMHRHAFMWENDLQQVYSSSRDHCLYYAHAGIHQLFLIILTTVTRSCFHKIESLTRRRKYVSWKFATFINVAIGRADTV